MKNILICPDSFKGSLSSEEAAEQIAKAAKFVSDQVNCIKIPIADGGEGTVVALGAKKVYCNVKGPLFETMRSFWGELGDTAVIESAACVGLPLISNPNPERTTTFGIGELIHDALEKGEKKIYRCSRRYVYQRFGLRNGVGTRCSVLQS